MYSKGDMTYADAGKLLVGDNVIAYQVPGDGSGFTEEVINIDDMRVEDGYLVYSGGRLREPYRPHETYASLKTRLVKRRYSNDDQIAIMLNDDAEAMEKMQEWRAWSARLAHKILSMQREEE